MPEETHVPLIDGIPAKHRRRIIRKTSSFKQGNVLNLKIMNPRAPSFPGHCLNSFFLSQDRLQCACIINVNTYLPSSFQKSFHSIFISFCQDPIVILRSKKESRSDTNPFFNIHQFRYPIVRIEAFFHNSRNHFLVKPFFPRKNMINSRTVWRPVNVMAKDDPKWLTHDTAPSAPSLKHY